MKRTCQIKSKLIIITHQCLIYIHKLANSLIISESFKKFANN